MRPPCILFLDVRNFNEAAPGDRPGAMPPAPGAGILRQPGGADLIHSVTNPTAGFTAALNVYRDDFFRDDRSEWEPETLIEQPFNLERAKRLFEESNARISRS